MVLKHLFLCRTLLSICAHSSEPALGLFLPTRNYRAPPDCLEPHRARGDDQGIQEAALPSCGSPGVSAGHLVGRTVLKETRDLHRSLWPWTGFLTFWAYISLAMKCGDSGPFVQTQ